MSKDNFSFIDEITAEYQIGFVAGDKDIDKHFKDYKQALIQGFKAAMLEVIGEDDKEEYMKNLAFYADNRTIHQNELRAELREALETLVNSTPTITKKGKS